YRQQIENIQKDIHIHLIFLRGILMNLTIDTEQEHDRTVLFLSGELDIYTAPNLKEKLVPLVEQKDAMVEIDMDEVNYMDSTGIGVFIHALKTAKQSGSKMKLTNLQEKTMRLFEITGLDEVLDINSSIRGGN